MSNEKLRKDLRHEFESPVSIVEGYREMARNRAHRKVPERWRVFHENNLGQFADEFVEGVRNYMDFLEGGEHPGVEEIEKILSSASKLEEGLPSPTSRRVRDTALLIEAGEDYFSNLESGREAPEDFRTASEMLEPFGAFDDLYTEKYEGSAAPDTSVATDLGPLLAFHTLAMNEDSYWRNNPDFPWEDEKDPSLETTVSLEGRGCQVPDQGQRPRSRPRDRRS